jgi:hypothetical protein
MTRWIRYQYRYEIAILVMGFYLLIPVTIIFSATVAVTTSRDYYK